MISFIEQTWYLWWIGAIVILLRWFHLFVSDREEAADDEEAAAIASVQFRLRGATQVFERERAF